MNRPVVRGTLGLLRDPLAFLRRAHQEHGPVFEVRAATRRFVVLAGRDANRFCGAEGRDALESHTFWGKLTERRGCPHAMIAVDGEPHRKQRKLFGDTLSRTLVDEHLGGCVDLVRSTFGKAESFQVREETRLVTARLVHHCLTRGAPPIDEATAHALTEVFRWESNVLLLGKWPRLAFLAPRYRRHRAIAERFTDELAEREATATEDDALAGWFARVREGRARYPKLFSEGDVRFAMLLPFVAGVDTVGATLGFVLYEIHRDAALRERVLGELAEAYRDGDVPDVATLRALPALNGLVLECLRLHPAAFAMYRGAARDFEIAGHPVTRGTDVVVFTSATHFNAEHFPDPDALDVDRHAPPRAEHRQKHVFMPYGAGPHVCLGAGMGEALLLLATATILRNLELRTPDPSARFGHVFDPSLTIDPAFTLQRA